MRRVYPTLCRGCYRARGRIGYLFEEPTSLNAVAMLPGFLKAGVHAFKIEGRQRGRAYVAAVVKILRGAIDAAVRGETPAIVDLIHITEGHHETLGGYAKVWH